MKLESFVIAVFSVLLAFVLMSIVVSLMHLLWHALFWLAIIGLGCVIYFMFSVWVRMRGHDLN